MSCPVNLRTLPSGVFEAVFTPENVRGRSFTNSLTPLTFPKSRSALWDGCPAGEKLRLHLCTHRKPRLVLLEKALRLAQRHARHSNKTHLHCFFLGSLSVDADEEGVTLTLDRFDPGRDQGEVSGRVPSTVVPGDVLVPCLISTDAPSDPVVQVEADLHQTFKVLQQFVSSRQALDLSQLLKVKGRVFCSQRSDATAFSLSWLAVCPAVSVDVQPVRAVPIIPTALLRSLTSVARPPSVTGTRQRGFLTMDQTRKLLLLLESDPKACSLPLIGLWLSGVTHVYSPQVWAWCLRFLFSNALQDRVLSESGCFLLVLFGATHRAPQFFQCRGSGPAQLDWQLLTASQSTTLYQVATVDGQTLQCEFSSEGHSRQMEIFREAQSSFNSAPPPAAGLSVSDQDSGVEDEDLSPRPSPSPHPPAQQARRVQPSVPELSLLIDSSFTSTQDPGPTLRPPLPRPADRKSSPPPASTSSSSSAPKLAPLPHLHSTPNSNLQQPCSCCSTHDCTSIFSSPGLHNPAPPLPSNLHPAPSHHQTPPPPPSVLHPAPSHHQTPPPPSVLHPAPSHHQTPPPSNIHPSTSVPSLSTCSVPSSSHPSASPLSTHHTPAPPTSFFPHPSCPCSHPPPPPSLPLVPWYGDSTPPYPSHPAADPASPPWLPRPSCLKPCCEQQVAVVPSDAYQLLLHQDRQLRLLQAQVQMLLEAQGKLQSSSRQVDTQMPTSTASIAVGTGTSLFWAHPLPPLPHQEAQAPLPSSPRPPPSSSSSTPSPPSSSKHLSHDLPVVRAQEKDVPAQEAPHSPPNQHSVSGLQSPLLGESVSMYCPADDQQSFYQNLMTQLTSRLQESDNRQDVKEEESSFRRRSMSVLPDHSQPSPSSSSHSSSSSSSSSSRRKHQSGEDPVVSATLRRLQQLGVDVDKDDLSESDRSRHKTVESTSTLACINPAAALSRLSVPEPGVSALFPGGSVDLSLEANAIALRYLSDSQLSRLSLGGHAPKPGPASSSSTESLLSPSNMSLATRKYMRRYGLIEEESGEEDAEEAATRQPLTEAQNVRLLPQSQLIRDLRPKMQLLAGDAKPSSADKENGSGRRPPLDRRTEGSVGNILDLSRLRQLPKLF